MSSSNIIKTINSNQEKYQLYKRNMCRYKKAIKGGFYFEALWILYAMLEARTGAFFYHLGFTRKNDRTKVFKGKRKEIRELLKMESNQKNYGFNKLGVKLDKMSLLFTWAKTIKGETNSFKLAVKDALLYIHSEEMETAIKYLKEEFCSKRNQLTHALFNKEPDEASEELKKIVEAGHLQMRVIDNAIDLLKSHSKIRRKFNIQ